MSHCCGTPASALVDRSPEGVRARVRDTYAEAAHRVMGASSCCGPTGCDDPITRGLYGAEESASVPVGAVQASLGCGNPTALVDLRPGEVVLDLGSGGGIDVLLSARRVAPGGWAYGLDMTDEMLELARENQRQAGIENAEFIRGNIEAIPLADATVDVILSNCVINLSPEKERVLREASRVLRPGGRLAIADMVFRMEPSPRVRGAADLWGACVGGALTERDYREILARTGFTDVEIEVTREFGAELVEEFPDLAGEVDMVAAFIRARKPT